MSYVPPHKRHENVALRASSVPPSLLTKHKNTKIIYANDFISRWFLVGSEDNNSFQLVPVSSEWRRESEDKPLVMLAKSESGKLEDPWLWVAEKVENDLMLGFGRAKETLLRYASDDVNLRLITRFGKAVFNGSDNSSDTLRDDNVTKRVLEKLKRSFRTNVPKSYVENTVYGVVPKMGFSVEETKELYHVKVFDNTRPDITISCKCMAELNALRHLIIDVSCLDQDLDMRLSVDSKRTLTNLSENEIKSLKELTVSAVIDPNVKGGLKWPLGKLSCGDRYSVCGVWHTVTTTYRNQTLRLQVREADRYDFRTGIGGASREVFLKLRALSKLLKEENVEGKCVSDMLKDCLKTVWDYFLKIQV
ncbi:BnaAnng35970D [Brassica napus]|uniref:BnaAnng35970D protein n=1 Tax=Brassica napus TaxID=3708 RepID=A0A078JWC0_BRANA|nr:BnaAnng35970D [Brassica napus]